MFFYFYLIWIFKHLSQVSVRKFFYFWIPWFFAIFVAFCWVFNLFQFVLIYSLNLKIFEFINLVLLWFLSFLVILFFRSDYSRNQSILIVNNNILAFNYFGLPPCNLLILILNLKLIVENFNLRISLQSEFDVFDFQWGVILREKFG